MNLHEADSGAESVYSLDLDALEGVGGFVEFMVRVGGLEREVGLQSFVPVLCSCYYYNLHEWRR